MIFTKFNPTEDRVKALSKKLMEEPLYLSDEFRDYELIHKILFNGFSNKNNIFYEIGASSQNGGIFGGIIGFVNIIPEFKCEIVFKLWSPGIWGFRFKTQIKELIKTIMEKYNLKRIATETADERMMRMGKIWGLKVEGRFKYAFRWEDKMYTIYKMRVLREEIE